MPLASPDPEPPPRVSAHGLGQLGLAWESGQEWRPLDWASLNPSPQRETQPLCWTRSLRIPSRVPGLRQFTVSEPRITSPRVLSVGSSFSLQRVFYVLKFYL